MANEVVEVIGRGARDAFLVASGSIIISVDLAGGFETFNSSSYNDGNGNITEAPPVDNTIWRIVVGS